MICNDFYLNDKFIGKLQSYHHNANHTGWVFELDICNIEVLFTHIEHFGLIYNKDYPKGYFGVETKAKGDKIMKYAYGMRARGCSVGCQPTDGFIERLDDTTGEYFDIITYDRELTKDEVGHYSLDRLYYDGVTYFKPNLAIVVKDKVTKKVINPQMDIVNISFNRVTDNILHVINCNGELLHFDLSKVNVEIRSN